MLELVVAGPIMTVIGVVVLGLQRRGIRAPTYIAPTSPAFDGVIAGCFVVVGLGLMAGALAYAAVSGLASSRGAAYAAWAVVGIIVTLIGGTVAWKRRQANNAPGRHVR
jgi:hypothetical protein